MENLTNTTNKTKLKKFCKLNLFVKQFKHKALNIYQILFITKKSKISHFLKTVKTDQVV